MTAADGLRRCLQGGTVGVAGFWMRGATSRRDVYCGRADDDCTVIIFERVRPRGPGCRLVDLGHSSGTRDGRENHL